jgi:rubredoxin
MFEGSYLGDDGKIDATDQMECGICWWVYDPAAGDALAHVPGGTPFVALPANWHCPNCDAPKHKFMVLNA